MFLRVSKYPPSAIFRSANTNAQHANVTGSMNWHNKTVCSWSFLLLRKKYCRLRTVGGRNASGVPCIVLVASEASFLVCSIARIFYLFQAVRRAVNVLNLLCASKYPPTAIFRNANINVQSAKRNRFNDFSYKSATAYVEHAFSRPMLASY